MALDSNLFESFAQDATALPLLRIYRTEGEAVTVGRSRVKGILDPSFVVRPTGGGLVRHGNDLLYSVIARRDSFPTFRQARTSYLSFHEVVQQAFRTLGIETRLFRCDDPLARTHARRVGLRDDCFTRPIPADVAVGNRKIAGAAQRRRREGFLHQGSIQLLDKNSYNDLKAALIESFRRKFDITWLHEERLVSV